MEIRNRSPFVAGFSVQLDRHAAEHLVMAVRGTWEIDERGRLAIATEQPPLQPADLHAGEPGKSSILYEADLGCAKPATDCALIGAAVAPRGRTRRMTVSFRVGPVAGRAQVTGERRRLFWLFRWWHSAPRPFDRVPLRWELAAGGTDTTPRNAARHSLDLRNPLGRGFRARSSRLPQRGAPLPQIESGRSWLGLRAGPPVGFGFTGGEWQHRRRWAGTYDEAWTQDRCPLLPDDFDERFHQAAAPGLATETPLVGGEPVEVRGCTRGGSLAFHLPRVALDVRAVFPEREDPIPLGLATVTVDTEAMRLRLLWRGALHVHGRFLKLRRLDVASSESSR